MLGVGRVAQEIEPGGLPGVVAGELDLLGPPADVEAVAVGHRVLLAVDRHSPVGPDVQHAQLPPLAEGCGPQLVGRAERQPGLGRHRGADNGPIRVAVDHEHLARLKEPLDQEMTTDLLGRHATEPDGIGQIPNVHADLLTRVFQESHTRPPVRPSRPAHGLPRGPCTHQTSSRSFTHT